MTATTSTATVLVVDDDPLNRTLLSMSLTGLGHQVLEAGNGHEAIARLAAERVDAVLTDIEMPEMDGYGLLRHRAGDARLKAIPFIVISGVDEMASIVECIKLGAEDYLPKPFDPVLLHARLGACLDKKRMTDELRDGLVNNAGIAVGGPVEVLTDEEWRWQMDVNFFSVVTLTREAMPLVDKADGRFVHIGSVAGRVGIAGLGPYAASKHAVSAFNWALRGELARNTKMRSSVVEPGEIKTAIWDKANDTLASSEAQLTGRLRDRYGFILDGQRAFVEHGKTKGIDADRVAKAVEHALTSPRPKARYLVGPDAKVVGILTKLPDALREKLIDLNARMMEKKGRKPS